MVKDVWDVVSLSSLKTYSVVMACVDNFEARLRLNAMCRLAEVDFVSAGIDSRYASVQRHPFASASEADSVACYECDLPQGAYATMSQRYSCGWLQKQAFIEKKVPTTVITASAAGSLAVSFALSLGDSGQGPPDTRRSLVDTVTGRANAMTLVRNPDCFGCGGLADATKLYQCRPDELLNTIDQHAGPPESASAMWLHLSEPVITELECVNSAEHTRNTVRESLGQPASRFTDALMHCDVCNDESVRVDMTDALSLADFRALWNTAVGVTCKYVRFATSGHDTIVEVVD